MAEEVMREDSPPWDTGHHLSGTRVGHQSPRWGPLPCQTQTPHSWGLGVSWKHKTDTINPLGPQDPGSEQGGGAAPWPVHRAVAGPWEVHGGGCPGLSLETQQLLGVQPGSTCLSPQGAEVVLASWGLESAYNHSSIEGEPSLHP